MLLAIAFCTVDMPPKNAKTRKRTHSEEEDETEIEESEVSNKDLLNAIAQLTQRMGAFENSITKVVDDKISNLEKNIMDRVNEHQQGTTDRVCNIERRMEDFIQQVSSDMSAVKDGNCSVLDRKIKDVVAASIADTTSGETDNRVDQLERQIRMNELVISGVPMVKDENLYEIIGSICKAINYCGGLDSIESGFCLPVHNNRRRLSPSIIVKFWGSDAKNEFFKRYFATKKLCTTSIGFSAPSRIYVNENLTKRNFGIFCMARDMKKDGKIAHFTTQRGRIAIKLLGSERSHTIDSLNHLSLIVNQAATASSMNQHSNTQQHQQLQQQ